MVFKLIFLALKLLHIYICMVFPQEQDYCLIVKQLRLYFEIQFLAKTIIFEIDCCFINPFQILNINNLR